ncbi:MAG: adenine phosphoribosyltransferase, partial [candidate division Zixibacteria bacterium]|nr:adenine phosphoribosyltransferase [candidate division Zixibacteria bacterium]
MDLKEKIRDIPDFPSEGILFRDITTLLADPPAFKYCINQFAEYYGDKEVTKIVGIEARGFIFGGVLAEKLGVGLVLVRKAGKLPAEVIEESYDLEYGSATIAIHQDALSEGDRVLIIDDLLATGGTAAASIKLAERLGATVVGLGFLVELAFLPGRERLGDYDIYSLVKYDS